MSERAPSISGLNVYLGNDGSVWAVNPADQRGYQLAEIDPSGGSAPGASPASGSVEEAPTDGQVYGRQNAAWSAISGLGAWQACTYPPGCSGTLQARLIGDPAIATIELIGQASSVSMWDGSYSFILAYLPAGLVPNADRFVLVPSSHTAGTPDSVSCAWFKPTGEIAIAFIYEKGQNPLIAWFDGVSIQV